MKNLKQYLVSLNGLLALLFGLVALLFPGITLAALGIYFAFSIMVGGISLVVAAFRNRKTDRKWKLIFAEGTIGVLIGIIILARPQVVATVFVTIMGLWAIVIGLIFLVAWLRAQLPPFTNTFVLIISLVSLLTGVVIIIDPFESTRVITVLIGIYALIYGLFSLFNARHTKQL